MQIKKLASIGLILAVVSTISACGSPTQQPSARTAEQAAPQSANQEAIIMDNFNSLLQKPNITAKAINKFADDNIFAVSRPNAAIMVIGLEKLQKDEQPKLEDKFAAAEEAVRQVLTKDYQSRLTDGYINTIQDPAVKELLTEAKNSGFKIETAEGMYFPVVDYSAYLKYREAVTPDIAAYINIMAVEADKTPAKDGALTISWAEILKRALNQEQFIKNYGSSPKAEEVRNLLQRYASFALYGANNTPLFDYETGQMVAEAKKAYAAAAFDANNGRFSQIMNEYSSVLKQNEYKLNIQVQEYRNQAAGKIR